MGDGYAVFLYFNDSNYYWLFCISLHAAPMNCWRAYIYIFVYMICCILPATEEVVVLPSYTVNTARIQQSDLEVPYAVSQIDQDRLQTASTQLSLDESLQTVPGVYVLNPYNFAQDSRIAIRGFGARANFGIRGVRLVVDGIPATTPDGQGSVDAIDLASAQTMQILRGPASALYGAASGGVILLETEVGPSAPFMETRWTFGEDGLRQSQFKAGGRSGHFNYLVSATDLEFDGYRDRSETESRRVNAKFGYDFNPDSSLSVVVNVVDSPLQNDSGGLTLAEVRADRKQARQRNIDFDGGESIQQEQLGLNYRHAFNDVHAIELKTYYTQRDFGNKLPFIGGGQVVFQRDFFGGGGLYRFSGDSLKFVVGVDYDFQDDARENYDNLSGIRGPLSLQQNEQVESFGVYASARWALNRWLVASAALRQDWIEFTVDDYFLSDGDDTGSRRFDELSPMIGLSWEVSNGLAVFINATTSFETPTSTELANPTGGGFNRGLEPQASTGFELGIKGAQFFNERRIRYELTAFHLQIEDALVPFELADSPGRDFYMNAGESDRTGIEAAIQFEPIENLLVDFSYTWSDFRYTEFSSSDGDFGDNRLPGIPQHYANIQVNYRHENGFFIRWNTRLNGKVYLNDANSDRANAYTVSDLRLGYQHEVGAWTVEPFVGINNVFDQTYYANLRINAFGGRYHEPAPGRNIYSGIRIRYTFN